MTSPANLTWGDGERPQLLDLFSGIGGFSLGLERAGFRTVAFCEVNPVCRHLLAHHWPEVPCYDDIRTLDRTRLAADGIVVDAICGGFPCQDISFAGTGAGIEGARSGLWREYARLVRELRPRLVFVENVAALLGRGLGVVLGDLAALGYDAWWDCIPAAAVGAPHRRDRLWLIAYARGQQHEGYGDALRWAIASELADPNASGERQPEARGFRCEQSSERPSRLCEAVAVTPRVGRLARGPSDASEIKGGRQLGGGGVCRVLADADLPRLEIGISSTGSEATLSSAQRCGGDVADTCRLGCGPVVASVLGGAEGQGSASAPADRRVTAGWSWWLSEPDVGRVAHGIPARVDRLHGLGNAVVPQIPEILGKAALAALRPVELAA